MLLKLQPPKQVLYFQIYILAFIFYVSNILRHDLNRIDDNVSAICVSDIQILNFFLGIDPCIYFIMDSSREIANNLADKSRYKKYSKILIFDNIPVRLVNSIFHLCLFATS